jgi:hypothetical protein
MTAHLRAPFVLAILVLGGCGPLSSVTPLHQPRVALLDSGGQMRLQAGVGSTAVHDFSATASVVAAPVDGLLVAGGVDLDPAGDTTHFGGDVAVGFFLPDQPVFRLEGFAGLSAGQATGWGEYEQEIMDGTFAFRRADLQGPYLQPYAQVAVGFEVPYFEMAFGTKLFGHLTDLRVTREDGTVEHTGYERLSLAPFLTAAGVFEGFRIETMFGATVFAAGEPAPAGVGAEIGADLFALLRIGYEFDLTPAPERAGPPAAR